MNQKTLVILFGKDLRLKDNPALYEASKTGAPLVLLYVLDEETPGKWSIGGAQKWWLHHSLKFLTDDLEKMGQTLVLRKGRTVETVKKVMQEVGATSLYYNRRYEPWFPKFKGIEAETFNASLLIEPWDISTNAGDPCKVFTPFWKKALQLIHPRKPLPKPKLKPSKHKVKSDTLSSWKLLPTKPDWSEGIREEWKPGEKAAQRQLDQFQKHISNYKEDRNLPGIPGTSKLSPYLHMGEISPHQIWDQVEQGGEGERVFLSEIGWREFSYHLLYHFPHITEKNFNPKFDKFPWVKDPEGLKLWQKGMTGYPIVDAGMRELWHTGWMHNRVRMIVASFLTKDLLINWKEGEAWFWDTLIDADLASNSASWQWVAGCGADAAPYFRVFNPTLQGIKFDPNGDYVRKWIPELKLLQGKTVHEPWKSGINLDYPDPIVDHAFARERALQILNKIK